MERVVFIIERTGDRIGCLLNPESLVMRRLAGVRPRRSLGGIVAGINLADDPLIYTGGGMTELHFDLLFDTSLSGSSIRTEDVRALTSPFWKLAENQAGEGGSSRPPLARFVWGKAWNILGIISAVAERLEYFTPGGAPRRSWLRMRFLRVGEFLSSKNEDQSTPLQGVPLFPMTEIQENQVQIHDVIGGTPPDRNSDLGERLDQIAHHYYSAPGLWRLLANFNSIDDPLHLPQGMTLRIPPQSFFEGK